jgi:hypothetical protein
MKKTLIFLFVLIPVIFAARAEGILPDSVITYRFAGPADSVFSAKFIYGYDSAGNMTSQKSFDWDSANHEWIGNVKKEYTYNSNGEMTLAVGSSWDPASREWKILGKEEHSYDSNGNQTSLFHYSWDANKNDWVENSKEEYTFDSAGNPAFIAVYDRDEDSGDWVWFGKFIRNYLPGGALLLDTQYEWDSNGNEWVPDTKTYYYYTEILFAQEAVICKGDSLWWKGRYLKADSTYRAFYRSPSGQDIVYEIDLHVDPGPSLFVIAGQNMVHASSIHIYTAPPQPNITYSWSIENGNIRSNPDDHSVEILWGTAGTGRIGAVAENQNGCLSDTVSLEVTIGSTGKYRFIPVPPAIFFTSAPAAMLNRAAIS